MNLDNIEKHVSSLYTKPLLTVSGTEITLVSIITFFVIIAFSIIFSMILQRILKRSLMDRFTKNKGTLLAILRLLHYTILLLAFAIAIQTIGINISALFAAGAVFAIAIGFAMQNVTQNFVSGLILLIERSIKPGDILEVEGNVVKVIDMGIRTSVVRTWRDEELIMPNSIISQSTVKNYTLRDNHFRLGVTVGVSYSSDMKKVMEVLDSTARQMPWLIKGSEPRVLLLDFGDSAVIFGVYLDTDEPWKQRVYMSDLRKAIWFAFQEAGIVIAFNQVDIHLDQPVTAAIEGLRKIK